jgi:hypothetical protein
MVNAWVSMGIPKTQKADNAIEAIALQFEQNLGCSNDRAKTLLASWILEKRKRYLAKRVNTNCGEYALDQMRAIALECGRRYSEFSTNELALVAQEMGVNRNADTVRNWARKLQMLRIIELTRTKERKQFFRLNIVNASF